MEIEFVNHASFILKSESTKLICDPWMEGTAFDDGWKLLSETKFRFEDFTGITHIWFSHEHPDHFAPANILKIPAEVREKITVLYQKTIDKKVSLFCERAGFNAIIELEADTYFDLPGIRLMCNSYTDGDSYIHFISEGISILNLNDCIVDTENKARAISKKIGAVDILFTQFGYANKVGNINDVEHRIHSSNEKLNRIKLQCEMLKPKFVIPFASFVWFCHQENYYMNSGMNRIDAVYDFILNNCFAKPVILFPGDHWNGVDEMNSSDSVSKYLLDYEKVKETGQIKSGIVSIEYLTQNAKEFLNRLKIKNSKFRHRISKWTTKIYVSDLQTSFDLNVNTGLRKMTHSPDECDINLASEALNYVFENEWGGDTLNVNARFQIPSKGNYFDFKRFAHAASLNNRGEEYSEPSFLKKVLRVILQH